MENFTRKKSISKNIFRPIYRALARFVSWPLHKFQIEKINVTKKDYMILWIIILTESSFKEVVSWVDFLIFYSSNSFFGLYLLSSQCKNNEKKKLYVVSKLFAD